VRDQGPSVVGAQDGWGGVVFEETSTVLWIGMYRSCRGVGAMGGNIPFLGDDVQGGVASSVLGGVCDVHGFGDYSCSEILG
jgi:hypothetical protein